MPKAAVEMKAAVSVLPVHRIAGELENHFSGQKSRV